MNTLKELATFDEFSFNEDKKQQAVISCSFTKDVDVECIVHDRQGRVRKNFTQTVTENTKDLTLDISGLNDDFFHVWFYVEGQAFVRELKLANVIEAEKETTIGRFLRFFT